MDILGLADLDSWKKASADAFVAWPSVLFKADGSPAAEFADNKDFSDYFAKQNSNIDIKQRSDLIRAIPTMKTSLGQLESNMGNIYCIIHDPQNSARRSVQLSASVILLMNMAYALHLVARERLPGITAHYYSILTAVVKDMDVSFVKDLESHSRSIETIAFLALLFGGIKRVLWNVQQMDAHEKCQNDALVHLESESIQLHERGLTLFHGSALGILPLPEHGDVLGLYALPRLSSAPPGFLVRILQNPQHLLMYMFSYMQLAALGKGLFFFGASWVSWLFFSEPAAPFANEQALAQTCPADAYPNG